MVRDDGDGVVDATAAAAEEGDLADLAAALVGDRDGDTSRLISTVFTLCGGDKGTDDDGDEDADTAT